MSDRQDRLAQAMVEGNKKASAISSEERLNRLGKELHHLENELAPHGLSVAALLRTVAKQHHGVTIPPYVEPLTDTAEA